MGYFAQLIGRYIFTPPIDYSNPCIHEVLVIAPRATHYTTFSREVTPLCHKLSDRCHNVTNL